MQDENQEGDPEARPGSTTQAHREGQKKEVVPTPEAFIQVEDIHFEECPVGRDLERPHKNRSLMSKWVGIVPSTNNLAYAFNVPIFGHEYAEMPYILKLISASDRK